MGFLRGFSKFFSEAGAVVSKPFQSNEHANLSPEEKEKKAQLKQFLKTQDQKTAERVFAVINADTLTSLINEYDYNQKNSFNTAWVTRFINLCTGMIDLHLLASDVRYQSNDPFIQYESVCIWLGFLLPIYISDVSLNINKLAARLQNHIKMIEKTEMMTSDQISLIKEVLILWTDIPSLLNDKKNIEMANILLPIINDALYMSERKPGDKKFNALTDFGKNEAHLAGAAKNVVRDSPSSWAFLYQELAQNTKFASKSTSLISSDSDCF